uniref:Uncharacterized protein n=1 Tax=Geladintestivirus 6 TaxID=3233138 RepID=A0AAU8MG93_9CAUD
MAKKHDENKDLRCVSRVGKINYSDKTLRVSKNATIGIHMWGRIDFLTHYCGWIFIWDNTAGVGGYYDGETRTERVKNLANSRKVSKEHSLTDKTKKSNKRK